MDVNNVLVAVIGLLSGAGVWNVVKDYLQRKKTKAETDNIVAGTYKELVIEIRKEISGLRVENTELYKEVDRLRMKYHIDMEAERQQCTEEIGALKIRIWQLENPGLGKS